MVVTETYEWSNRGSPPAYVDVMRAEHAAFAGDYRRRMVRVMNGGALGRVRWQVALRLVESWSTFRAGRFIRRLQRRGSARKIGK